MENKFFKFRLLSKTTAWQRIKYLFAGYEWCQEIEIGVYNNEGVEVFVDGIKALKLVKLKKPEK